MSKLPKVTRDSFQAEVLQADGPVLVDFGADWCPPCRAMEPILEAVDADRDDLRIVSVDTDADPELAARYGILGLPTMVLFSHGEEQARIRGFVPRRQLEEVLA